jgi:glycosyltransferase involved in cell wall biosynthesis
MKQTREPKNVGMLAFTNYESDGRIIRYAQTLVKRGDRVDVIACAKENETQSITDSDGATLHKIYNRRENRSGCAFSYFVPLIFFAIKAFFIITRNHFTRRYDLIHVHNIPEWLVFSTWIPKLTGTKIILDLHDLVPELFSAKFKRGSRSILDSLLKLMERWSCKFSDHVIISNDLWKKTVTQRSVGERKCSVFFNNIDPDLFYPREKTRRDDRKIVIFPGSLQWHQGVDIAIRAFPQVKAAIPTAEFHIYGGGAVLYELEELVEELNLEDTVLFKGSLPISDIPQTIANADVGVVPKRADSFGNEAYSTKIMEFMSQRLPTVISRTAIDDFYFDDSQTRFCESGNVEEFAQAMIDTLTDETLRASLIENASAYVAKNNWGSKKHEYLSIVDYLIKSESLPEPDALLGAEPINANT